MTVLRRLETDLKEKFNIFGNMLVQFLQRTRSILLSYLCVKYYTRGGSQLAQLTIKAVSTEIPIA